MTPQWAESFMDKLEGIDQKVDQLAASASSMANSMAPMCAAFIGRTLESKTGSESASTKQLQQKSKLNLIQAYQRSCTRLPKKMQCMVSGLQLDSDIVRAAHLVAKSAERVRCRLIAALPIYVCQLHFGHEHCMMS